jgi:uncharacterized delta-60 repeat protein
MKNTALLILLVIGKTLLAQIVVGDSTGNCNSAAILDARSHNKGFLIPRMNQNQADAITNPAEGLMFYNNTTGSFNFIGNNTTVIIDSSSVVTQDNVMYQKTVQVDNQDDEGFAVCTTSDGGVLIAGSARINTNGTNLLDYYFLKLTSSGNPDKNFGTDGKVVVNTGGYERIYSVVQTYDGGYAAAGYTTNSGCGSIIKLNADGTLDTQFGNNGIVSVSGTSKQVFLNDIKQTADSGFIAVGDIEESGNGNDFYIVKLTKTGALDNNFNSSGSLTVGVQNKYEYAYSVDVTNDNKYFVTGYQSSEGVVILKLNQDGTFNPSFNGGKIMFKHSGYEKGYGILALDNGGCVIIGSKLGLMFVAKINAYVTNLKSRSFSSNDYYLSGKEIIKASDSTFLIAGYASSKNNDSAYFFLTKIDTALNVVSSFGHNGYLLVGNRLESECNAVCKTNDKGYVAVGYTKNDNEDEDIYFVKINGSGRSCGTTYGLNITISVIGVTDLYNPVTGNDAVLHNYSPTITSQGTITTICN